MKILKLFKKIFRKIFRKQENPELITEYDLLKAIKEKLTDEEFEVFLKNGGHKILNSCIFFYDNEVINDEK